MQLLRLERHAIVNSDGRPFASVSQANLLDPASAPLPHVDRIVAWSGWFGPAAPESGRFEREFRTWTPETWAALEAECGRLLPALSERGSQVLLRPHARHVLADPQSCVNFFHRRDGMHWRLFIDAASMLTGAMLASAEDHLARIFGSLLSHPAAAAVLLANVAHASDEDEDLLRPAPLHRGLIEPRLIVNAWRAGGGRDVPCVLLEEEFIAQTEILA